MMDYSSREKKPDDVRNSVFNTINLINDLESGGSSPQRPSGGRDKEVSLSPTFVDGIKDKLVDYSKASKSSVNAIDEEAFSKLRQSMENQLNELKKIIASNQSEISSLKETISSLRGELAEVSKARDSVSSPSMEEETSSIFQHRNEDHESSGMQEEQQELVSGFGMPGEDSSIFEPMKEEQKNFMAETSAHDIISQPTVQESAQAPVPAPQQVSPQPSQPPVQHPPQQEAPPKEADPNPRVGSYDSGDVLIEKYFYYGNK